MVRDSFGLNIGTSVHNEEDFDIAATNDGADSRIVWERKTAAGNTADTTTGGNQAFNFVGAAAFGSAGDLRFVTNGFDGFVLGDVCGNGTVDLNILLEGVGTLTAGDFVL